MTKRVDELVQSICGPAAHPLAPYLREWCNESRLVSAFVEEHAAKIRKKARLAQRDDDVADLLAELAVAGLLARDRRFSLRYEPQRAPGQRSPDFQALFKTHLPLHVEVTRLRLLDPSRDDTAAAALKLARAICDKIGQFPAGAMSLLAAVIPPAAEGDSLAPAAIHLLDSYLQRELTLPAGAAPELRQEELREYLRQRPRLSAIALCSFTEAWRPRQVTLWLNAQARHSLHPEVAKYLAQVSTPNRS